MSALVSSTEVVQAIKDAAIANYRDLIDAVLTASPFVATPVDSGRKAALSQIWSHWSPRGDWFFVIHEHNVWPSSNLPELPNLLRSARGLSPIGDQQCERGDQTEVDYLRSLIFCGFSFYWAFLVVWPESHLVFYGHHDEIVGAWSKDIVELNRAIEDTQPYARPERSASHE